MLGSLEGDPLGVELWEGEIDASAVGEPEGEIEGLVVVDGALVGLPDGPIEGWLDGDSVSCPKEAVTNKSKNANTFFLKNIMAAVTKLVKILLR
jgi:hypothetical protein